MSLNKVLLIGNVGMDPEVRYLDGSGAAQGSSKVASIRLATTEKYKDRNGEVHENTEWHSITAWRQQADLAEKFIKKGSQIYVEGRLRTRSYTDAQGVKKYVTEIEAGNIQLLGRREGSEGGYAPAAPAAPAAASAAPAQPAYQPAAPSPAPAAAGQRPIDISTDSDDLPF